MRLHSLDSLPTEGAGSVGGGELRRDVGGERGKRRPTSTLRLRDGSRQYFQARRLSQRSLALVKRQKRAGSRQYRRRHVKRVRRTNTDLFRVIHAQFLRLAKRRRPRQGDANKEPFGKVFLDLTQRAVRLLPAQVPPEYHQPDPVPRFQTMKRVEGECLRVPRHQNPRRLRIRIPRLQRDEKGRIRIGSRRGHSPHFMAS